MSQNTKLLDHDLEDLHADVGRIFHAVDLKLCGWRVAALRVAAQEFATALFSVFRDQTSPIVRRQLARVVSECTASAVALGQQDVVREALQQFDQLRLPADQLRALVTRCLQALQESQSALRDASDELMTDIDGELELRETDGRAS